MQATQSEIAAWFGVSRPTIERRAREPQFREAMEHGYARGRISLRRWQFQAARKLNPTMLIWLGKQYLGQSNNPAPQPSELPSITVTYVEPPKQIERVPEPLALPPASAVPQCTPEACNGTVSRFSPVCRDGSERTVGPGIENPSHALIERLLAEPSARPWLDRLLAGAPKRILPTSAGAFS